MDVIKSSFVILNGAKRSRTADLCNAIAALYQLSYNPVLNSSLLSALYITFNNALET